MGMKGRAREMVAGAEVEVAEIQMFWFPFGCELNSMMFEVKRSSRYFHPGTVPYVAACVPEIQSTVAGDFE